MKTILSGALAGLTAAVLTILFARRWLRGPRGFEGVPGVPGPMGPMGFSA